ncbi:hypothetical protein AS142_08625 [Bacillus pumilus]|jgi:hypothetical protein|nr:hypothetical protein AS142_08625 [Bacillus pumilus]
MTIKLVSCLVNHFLDKSEKIINKVDGLFYFNEKGCRYAEEKRDCVIREYGSVFFESSTASEVIGMPML